MSEAKRVTHFVRGVLPAAPHCEGGRVDRRVERGEPRLIDVRRCRSPLDRAGRNEPRVNVVIGGRAVRIHAHRGLDDLSRARIDEARSP